MDTLLENAGHIAEIEPIRDCGIVCMIQHVQYDDEEHNKYKRAIQWIGEKGTR